MTCILKACANEDVPCTGQCGAESALELSRRNDGYLMEAADNPTLMGLREAGLVSTRVAGDGYLVVRAVTVPMLARRVAVERWHRAVKIGAVLA